MPCTNFGQPVGGQVATYTGWQSYATTTIAPTEIADPELGRPLEWISVLGTTGVTAYACHTSGRNPAARFTQPNVMRGSVRVATAVTTPNPSPEVVRSNSR
jgi:NADPH-dependent curcumin reductase CurA